jgi:26S proteasome regulatory subunit N12
MLTSAVLLAAKIQDDELFKSSVAQLRVLYADYPHVVAADKKCNVVGLILLRLLADDELAAFHCELELLSAAELAAAPVVFVTSLAQSLDEGSYHHVISAKPPSAPFAAFMPKLTDAVRVDIANCSEKAYASLSVADAQRHMFLDSEAALLAFIENHEREWQVRDGRVFFETASAAKVKVPSKALITQSLAYANELERIV